MGKIMGGKTVPFSPKKQRQTICLHCEKKETVQTCPIVLSWPDQESGVNGQHVHEPATTRPNINRSRQGSGLVSLRYPPPTWRSTETSSPVRTWESLKSPGSAPFIRVQVRIIFFNGNGDKRNLPKKFKPQLFFVVKDLVGVVRNQDP